MTDLTVHLFERSTGHHWQLFQGDDCVGTSENPSLTRERALAAARRWAKKYGYGSIVGERHRRALPPLMLVPKE